MKELPETELEDAEIDEEEAVRRRVEEGRPTRDEVRETVVEGEAEDEAETDDDEEEEEAEEDEEGAGRRAL
jgi:hypothetical protein